MHTLKYILLAFGLFTAVTVQAWPSTPAWPNSQTSAFLRAAASCNVYEMNVFLSDMANALNAADIALYNGKTALVLTVEANCKDMFKVLLDNGADVNRQDMHGRTALMAAILHGSALSYIEALAKHPNIDVYIVDEHGITALEFAEQMQLEAINKREAFKQQNINHRYQYNGYEHSRDIRSLDNNVRYANKVLKLVQQAQ